eukprot:GAHX01004694.1.p1 GENE.GAHX01004694.1~~GAHX01004694.1.p1  ORF type:complete len:53 (+),score=1.86 GAHX01004694.1:30-188(+)
MILLWLEKVITSMYFGDYSCISELVNKKVIGIIVSFLKNISKTITTYIKIFI